jgi:hypothetical protein
MALRRSHPIEISVHRVGRGFEIELSAPVGILMTSSGGRHWGSVRTIGELPQPTCIAWLSELQFLKAGYDSSHGLSRKSPGGIAAKIEFAPER